MTKRKPTTKEQLAQAKALLYRISAMLFTEETQLYKDIRKFLEEN